MTHRWISHVLAAALVLAVTLLAPLPAAWAQDNPVAVRAVPQYAVVEQGGRLVIAVEMVHQTGFHTWPAPEVKLPADIAEFAIRTEIGAELDADAIAAAQKAAKAAKKSDAEIDAIKVFKLPAWVAKVDGVQYPEAHKGKVADPSGGSKPLEVPLYSGKAVTYIRLEVKADSAPGDQVFNVRVAYQSCDENVCTPPQDLVVPVKVRVVKKGDASAGLKTDVEAALFTGFDVKKWGSGGAGGGGEGAKPAAPKPDAKPQSNSELPSSPISPAPIAGKITPNPAAASAAAGATLFGMDIGSNIFVLALASMLGGFILNLTPCVLPVIPIKVMSLTQHATSRAHALVLGLWMAAGVVAFWTAVGLPMAIISRQLDPSQYIFGTWWVCLVIGVVVALLGLGIMGLFTLNLPQSVYMVETKADSPAGAFLFGILAAVLGLPCFGFMAGGLLAAASALPAVSIMTIFVCLGIGMASPYLVLSVWPQLLKFIPRTGPASELVKQVLGILMIAAAAYFVTAGIQVLLAEFPYLAGSMVWWAVGFFIAIASLWLIIRTWQISRSFVRRALFTLIAFCMTGGIWVFAQDRLVSDRTSFLEREQAMKEASAGHTTTTAELPPGVWFEYTPESFAAVRASGRPVFLDFTASWCITCKALKAAILDPLKPEFKRRGVILLEVNCSYPNSPGSKFLRELNRTGVPTWVVYAPGSDAPHIVPVDKPSAGTVTSALDAAGITATATATATSGTTEPPKLTR